MGTGVVAGRGVGLAAPCGEGYGDGGLQKGVRGTKRGLGAPKGNGGMAGGWGHQRGMGNCRNMGTPKGDGVL